MANLNTSIGPERVQVFDQPIGTVQVAGQSISKAGFMISTSLGGAPENVPTDINTFDEFVETFGDADDVGAGFYEVLGYYDNAGTGAPATIVNVGSAPTAADYVGSASAGTGLRAFDTVDDIGLVVAPDLPLEEKYLVDSAVVDYCETVRAEFGSTLSTCFSLIAVPQEISKADRSVDAGLGDLTVTVAASLQINFNATDLSAITAGMVVKKAGVLEAVITSVDDGGDKILVSTLGTIVATDVVTLELPSAIEYKDEVINNPSRFAAWYFNNFNVLDQTAAATPGDLVQVGPGGHVAGIIGRIDANRAIGGPSHAPAGIQFAGIAGIQGLTLTLSERLDGEPLRLAFLNRITSFPGQGNVIFGGYTAAGSSATADEQLIQVMRTLQFIKVSLEPGLRGFLWENFSPATQAQVANAINSFMRNNSYLFPVGLSEAQQFKVISIEPTQDELDNGLLRVRVQIRPNKAVRFIEITLEFPIPAA